jgi:hypothetical protein
VDDASFPWLGQMVGHLMDLVGLLVIGLGQMVADLMDLVGSLGKERCLDVNVKLGPHVVDRNPWETKVELVMHVVGMPALVGCCMNGNGNMGPHVVGKFQNWVYFQVAPAKVGSALHSRTPSSPLLLCSVSERILDFLFWKECDNHFSGI